MTSGQARLTLTVDVFDKKDQRALALPTLKPAEFVEAILEEFRGEVDTLGGAAREYFLVHAASRAALDDAAPLASQVEDGARLELVEREAPPPPGARLATHALYLREQATGKVFRLPWLPAIVGRASDLQPHNELLVVDLASFPTALRVSRRHLMIAEEGDRFLVHNLANNNPASLIRASGGDPIPIGELKQPLRSGDVIDLERSEIKLKFIVRDDASS